MNMALQFTVKSFQPYFDVFIDFSKLKIQPFVLF